MEEKKGIIELDEVALVRLYDNGEVMMRVRVGDKLVDTIYRFAPVAALPGDEPMSPWAHVETKKVA